MTRIKTKIVCTLSTMRCDREFIRVMVQKGMNVVRMNFSHMSPEQAVEMVENIRAVREEEKVPLSIMLDTKGPEVRIYGYPQTVPLVRGDRIEVESYTGAAPIEDSDTGREKYFYTNLDKIGKLSQGFSRVLLMDGYIEGEIVDRTESTIIIEILNAGDLRKKAHLSIPRLNYPLPFLSTKDMADIRYAVEAGLDYIALSFVRSAEDLFQVRALIRQTSENCPIKLIAKIESKQAIDNLDEIIRYADGVMVARGDLGVELDLEEVPVMQKSIIEKCYMSGKPVITATQMLESMIDNRMPTRAEASDVANACYDLSSAVMLSGETAIGKYPELVMDTMSRILRRTEEFIDYDTKLFTRRDRFQSRDLTSIISYNAVTTAYQSNASAIVVFTKSGYSARMISKMRPKLPIYAFTPDMNVYHQLALSWGIFPTLIDDTGNFEQMLELALEQCENQGYLNKGDLAVIVAGLPMGVRGRTNMIRVESIGKTRLPVKIVSPGNATAPIVHVLTEEDLSHKDVTGKIVLLHTFCKEYTGRLRYAAGIVIEEGEYESHLQVLGMAYSIPVLVNARGAMQLFREGTLVEIDPDKELLIEL